MAQIYERVTVVSQVKTASDVYSMWLDAQNIADLAEPGQFLSIYPQDGSRLLPRPISICEVRKSGGEQTRTESAEQTAEDGMPPSESAEQTAAGEAQSAASLSASRGSVRIVYRVVGGGTEEFSRLSPGDTLEVMGPLGHGFPLKDQKALLIGGGIGIPPLLELAKQLPGEKEIVLGYRDELFLQEEFASYGNVYTATEDGSAGTRGTVLDAIAKNQLTAGVIYACGPTPMLRALKAYAAEKKIICYLSLEERMACGIGACLACVCETKEVDAHSQVCNKRVCKDGPVFLAEEVQL